MKIIYEKIIGWAVGYFVGLKLYLAIAIGALVVISGVWLHGYMSGRAGADNKALKQKIVRLEKALEGSEKLILEHAKKSSNDTALDRANEEHINATPSDNRICLDRSHIKRLRELK